MHPNNREVGRCSFINPLHLEASSALNISAGGSGLINVRQEKYPDKVVASNVERGEYVVKYWCDKWVKLLIRR